MVDARPWSVNLEHGERWWYAHVVELPGCFTRGESRDEVLDALPGAIVSHLAFLEARGHPPEVETVEIRVAEEIDGIPELGETGGAVALFASDERPVGDEEFGFHLDLMRWNREALLDLVNPLSEEDRTAKPIPDKWTINETLRHVANAEEWYISRLGLETQREYESFISGIGPTDRRQTVLERLDQTRRGVVHALEQVFARGVQGIFARAAYTRHPEERWTFRKVLRRFVEHELEHIGTIMRVADELAQCG